MEGCRTNNVIEGWHRGIQGGLDGDHPSLWKFLGFLQTEEQTVAVKDEQITAGQNNGRKNANKNCDSKPSLTTTETDQFLTSSAVFLTTLT